MSPIPLPTALDGIEEERVIRLDSALFYLINAALTALIDKTSYMQTGSLTEDDVKNALEAMLEDYFT